MSEGLRVTVKNNAGPVCVVKVPSMGIPGASGSSVGYVKNYATNLWHALTVVGEGTDVTLYLNPNGVSAPVGEGGGPVAGETSQIYSGSFADPNGNVTPTDQSIPAVYYNQQASPIVMWLWNTSTNLWFVALS